MTVAKRNIVRWFSAILIIVSCKPKPEVSFDVDSFQKSLEEIASGVIEWEHSVGIERKDTLNAGDKFEYDSALSDSVVLRKMKGYLGSPAKFRGRLPENCA